MANSNGKPLTLPQKVWDRHVVQSAPGEPDLLYIDLHLVHEVTSPQAFDGLRINGRKVRRPRILFLADRNILANQAFNAFGAFPDDALVRIKPSDIARKGAVPKNGSVFFTIFQTFMSGRDVNGNEAPYFGE